ncbi:unnamed protein product [Diamesa tonsa]
MRIAVEGCAHGELEKIYDVIQEIEVREHYKVDLLICCGDFQSNRNLADLQCMAVPKKYLDMCSFYKYYSGEKVAPILTIFIGGNHESSNFLQELGYGGWVAPNIYYLGYAGVITVNGIRIGGISGIFKGYNFNKGHFEMAPYDENNKKSVYHIRSLEVFRLKQLSPDIDIMLSHDWPANIYNYGNLNQLLRFKPYFREDIENNRLGSPPCEDLLFTLRPRNWFSAHLHCRFDATVDHNESERTHFLALDKCLPRRHFLEVILFGEEERIIEGEPRKEIELCYDLEWLTILSLTNNLLNVKSSYTKLPREVQPNDDQVRCNFNPTNEEMDVVMKKFDGDLKIPRNFVKTVRAFDPNVDSKNFHHINVEVTAELNPQTTQFCEKLGIDDPMYLALVFAGRDVSSAASHLESTKKLEEKTTEVSTKRAPLSSFLPKPKWSEEIDLDDLEEDASVDEKIEPSIEDKSETPEPQPTVTPDSSTTVPDSSTEVSQPIVSTSTDLPPVKKFKRRNQDIYTADDEET